MHKYGLISTREGYNLFYKQYWGKILTYFSLTDQLEGLQAESPAYWREYMSLPARGEKSVSDPDKMVYYTRLLLDESSYRQ